MPAATDSLDPAFENKLCNLLIARVQDYAIFMLSPDGKVMSWNEGARLIKGYQRSEIIGQPMSRFYTPEDQRNGRPWELLKQATENGRVEDEGWRVRKDGSRFWADVVVTALRDDMGYLNGFAKITRDLTERRKAEAAIGELSGRLFRIQDEERQRLAGQLHDRTSAYLTAVLTSLYKVKSHLKSQDAVLLHDVAESIGKVEAASDVIRRVAHMLHPSRLEQGGLVETLRWYVNAITGQRLSVRAELPEQPIGVSKEREIVLFRLVQECLNLMVGRAGARTAVVTLTAEKEVLLRITINGPPPPGLHDILSAGQSEFGIGFAGIRERLRQLGGALAVQSSGEKSVVEAALPIER